jgi:hypothetical protein
MLGHMRQNAVAYLALFLALGGTSYAAAQLPKNSVGTKQIKKNGVRSSDIKKNAVNSAKIKDGSVSADDLAAGLGAKGDTGAQGPQGVKGDKGAKGDKGDQGEPGTPKTFRRAIGFISVPDNSTGSVSVNCNADEIAISGGFANSDSDTYATRLARDLTNPRQYDFEFRNGTAGGGAAGIFPEVICVK